MAGRLTVQERAQIAAITKFGDPLLKCKYGGEPLREDMLKFKRSSLFKPKNLEELEGRIREVMSCISQEFLVKSVDVVQGRLENLVVNDGAHIEF